MLDKIVVNNMTFKQRNIPISAEYRPMFRISLIVLILDISSTKKQASLLKLHLLSWALKEESNRATIFKVLSNENINIEHFWSIEPSINRALSLAVAEKIVSLENGKYKLASNGKKLLNLILKDSTILIEERLFLNKIGSKLGENKISEIAKKWIK